MRKGLLFLVLALVDFVGLSFGQEFSLPDMNSAAKMPAPVNVWAAGDMDSEGNPFVWISWTYPTDVPVPTGFFLLRDIGGSYITTVTYPWSSFLYTDSTVVPGAMYTYTLYAYKAEGTGVDTRVVAISDSMVIEVYTPRVALITGVHGAIAGERISWEWDKILGATSYEISITGFYSVPWDTALHVFSCAVMEEVASNYFSCEARPWSVHPSGVVTMYQIMVEAKFAEPPYSSYGGKAVNFAVGDLMLAGVSSQSATPENFSLAQNYPNPFNPTTAITYDLPVKSHIRLTVFNAMGQVVAKLVDAEQPQGSYRTTWDGSNLPSGVYFYRLEGEGFIKTMKMTLKK
ncbi:MAG TPA: T9SS type A sorting domain-containing protein [bacterium]|nr:T9SS type A sorting domain-containing protein [bacterium]